jgi:hypothetical protein
MSAQRRAISFQLEEYRNTGRKIEQTLPGGAKSTNTERQRVIRHYSGEVELEINFEAILRDLGRRALANRGGKAVAMSGLITCKRVGPPVMRDEAFPVRPLTDFERYV